MNVYTFIVLLVRLFKIRADCRRLNLHHRQFRWVGGVNWALYYMSHEEISTNNHIDLLICSTKINGVVYKLHEEKSFDASRTSLAVATRCVDWTITVVVVEKWTTLTIVQTRILRLTHCISCNHPGVSLLSLIHI